MLQKALKSLKDVFSQNSFFRFWPPVWRKSSFFFYQAEFGKEKREFTEAKHKGRVMVCLSNFKETQKLFFPEYKSNMCYCRTFGKYSKGEN